MGSSSSIALACGVIAVAAACESTLMPPPSTRLAEVRRAAPFGHGNFFGRVFGSNLPQPTPCWRTGRPVPGIRVDLGVWHGNPAYYRDTLTHELPSTLAEPRFELIDSTTTDAEGRFVFAQLPRRVGFAFRAVPSPGSPWKVVYGISLSGIGDSDTPDHPTLCLSPA